MRLLAFVLIALLVAVTADVAIGTLLDSPATSGSYIAGLMRPHTLWLYLIVPGLLAGAISYTMGMWHENITGGALVSILTIVMVPFVAFVLSIVFETSVLGRHIYWL